MIVRVTVVVEVRVLAVGHSPLLGPGYSPWDRCALGDRTRALAVEQMRFK